MELFNIAAVACYLAMVPSPNGITEGIQCESLILGQESYANRKSCEKALIEESKVIIYSYIEMFGEDNIHLKYSCMSIDGKDV